MRALFTTEFEIIRSPTMRFSRGEATPTKFAPVYFRLVSALRVEEQRVNAIGDFVDAHRLGDAYRVDVQIVIWQG